MPRWPFRFLHAADLHLERPAFGIAEVPDHLRQLFTEAGYWAAERVFQTALAEGVELVVLSGDVLDPAGTGPRGPRFLLEQFERLAARSIAVYWAGGSVDPPKAWPAALKLPKNVRVFPAGKPQDFVHCHDDQPLVRLIGAGRTRRRIQAADFDSGQSDLFSIAVAHGRATADSLRPRAIDYWALGGRHAPRTLIGGPHLARYCGSPQGRQPGESGPHGATLVDVDSQGRPQATMVATDVLRWQTEQIRLDADAARAELESQLHERARGLKESLSGIDVMVTWKIAAGEPLSGELRRGRTAAELLDALRRQYGSGPPAVWSVALSVETPAELPPEWFEQDTILGDFLREVRRLQADPDEPLGLEALLSEEQLAGSWGAVATIADSGQREETLREAAMLGADLLSGEVPQS